jgi:hypothetical protein
VGHLGYFQNLAAINSVVINMGMQVAVSYPGVHFSLGYMPNNGISGSYGSSIYRF